MFLLVDFKISEFLPKIKGNERARSIAADLMKEGRKNYRKGRSKGLGNNIVAHDIDHGIPAVSQKYLNTYGNRKNGLPRKVSGVGFTPINEAFVQNKLGNPVDKVQSFRGKIKKRDFTPLKKDPIVDDKDFQKAYSAIKKDASKNSVEVSEASGGGSLRGYYKGQKPLAGLLRRRDILESDKEKNLRDVLSRMM